MENSIAHASKAQVQLGAAAVIDVCGRGQWTALGGFSHGLSTRLPAPTLLARQISSLDVDDGGNLQVRIKPIERFADTGCYGSMPPHAAASHRKILSSMVLK